MSEKRRIADLTLEPGASVALVARANGVNANQVFKWRRALKRELIDPAETSSALLPVTLSTSCAMVVETREAEAQEQLTPGAIHIEFPGVAVISVECGAEGHKEDLELQLDDE